MKIYKREAYLSKIRPFIDKEPVKVITGMRRSGKSILMHQIMDEIEILCKSRDNIFFMDMESLEGRKISNEKELCEHIEKWAENHGKVYIFLDEIQNLEGWEKCIRSLIVDLNADIYLTGSSSKMLSGELATHLAGRYVEFRVYPFSFSEIIDIEKINNGNRSVDDLFKLYIKYGGMPMVVYTGYDKLLSKSITESLYQSVVINDISERKNIRNKEMLRNVLEYVMSEIGHTISSINITKYLMSQNRSANNDRVLEYLEAAEDAMFISKARRQNLKGKEILKTDYKFYLTDLGFRDCMGFNNTESIDQSLENIVYNELLRRGYHVTVGKGRDSEIDFVAENGETREYYQISYILTSENTIEREFGALNNIKDSYPKFVLSMDKFDMSRDGIIHKNIVEWLLDNKY